MTRGMGGNSKNRRPRNQKSRRSANLEIRRLEDREIWDQETGRPGDWETGRLGNRETRRLGDRETGRPGDRETGRQGDRETERPGTRETDRENGRLGDRETGRPGHQDTGRPGDWERETGRKIRQQHKVDSKKIQKSIRKVSKITEKRNKGDSKTTTTTGIDHEWAISAFPLSGTAVRGCSRTKCCHIWFRFTYHRPLQSYSLAYFFLVPRWPKKTHLRTYSRLFFLNMVHCAGRQTRRHSLSFGHTYQGRWNDPPCPSPFRFWLITLPYSKQGGVDSAYLINTCPFGFSDLPKALHIGLVLLHEQTSCQKIYEWGWFLAIFCLDR